MTTRSERWSLLRAGAVAAAICGLAVPAPAQVQLPDFGDPSGGVLTPAEERRFGEAFMRAVRSSTEIVDDPEITAYVQGLGKRLAAHADRGESRFTFFAIADPSINAFAGPGGYIGIHSGLVLASEVEGELAAVVAHEIAHITQRHIARAFALSDRTNLPALAGLVAAVLVGTQNAQAGQAAAAAVTGARIQSQIDFTRANELEADRVGMQLLHDAGFDPRAMPAMFERLQSAGRYYRAPPEFLSTHPVTSSRIGDSRSRAEQYPYRQHPDSDAFHLARAKLRVLTATDPRAVLADYERALADGNYRHLAATAYGWALSLSRMKRHGEADEVLASLVEKHPERTVFRTEHGNNALAANRVQDALEIFEAGHALYPDNRGLVLGLAQARIRAGRAREALALLGDFGRTYGDDPRTLKLAAEAHRAAGNVTESLLALAEHYYADGQLDLALHQLRQANERRDADYYLGSRVAARLKELEAERRARTGR